MQEKYKGYITEELVFEYQCTKYEKILEEIMARCEKLFYLWMSDYCLSGYDTDDMIQEAHIALLRALNTYSDNKSVKFISYLRACVKQAYNRIYNHQHRQKRVTEREAVSWEELESIHREKSVDVPFLSDLELQEFISSLEGNTRNVAVEIIKGCEKKRDIAEVLQIRSASVTYHIKRLQKAYLAYENM